MKKALILVMICSICFTISGCFGKDSGESNAVSEKTAKAPEPSSFAQSSENATEKAIQKPQKADWRSLYADYIRELGNNYEKATYALVLIDDNDVPELLINNETFHGGGKTLLWVLDGKLQKESVSDMSGGDYGYSERTGSFWNMFHAQGSCYSLYSFSGGAVSLKDTAEENSIEPSPKYRVNSEDADKSAYEEAVTKIKACGTSKPLYKTKGEILDDISKR